MYFPTKKKMFGKQMLSTMYIAYIKTFTILLKQQKLIMPEKKTQIKQYKK